MTHQRQNDQSQPRPTRLVIVRESPVAADASERVGRLAALLSEALSPRLAQLRPQGQVGSRRLDYTLNLSPTTDDQSNMPGGCTNEDP